MNIKIDNIDWHFDKVKCRKIEQMMPKLMKMVEEYNCQFVHEVQHCLREEINSDDLKLDETFKSSM